MSLFIVFVFLDASAQENEEDLFELSLEDLMNMSITGASKKAERITDAPSIITAISQEEIQKFGGNNLIDVLQRAASIYNISSLTFRNSTVGVRGDLGDEVNSHILFMINGRPFRESNKAGLNASLLSAFPLSTINRIEIIRGPGSVLHGSNAYVAVVNVITDEDFSETTVNANIKYGSFNSRQVDASLGTNVRDINVSAAINVNKSDGWLFTDSLRGRQQVFVDSELAEDALGLNFGLAYKGLTARAYYGRNEMNNISTTSATGNIPYQAERLWFDIGYADTLFQDKYSFALNFTTNNGRDDFKLSSDADEINKVNSSDYLFELTNFYKLTDKVNLTFGGTVNVLSGDESTTLDDEVISHSVSPYDKNWLRIYAQADYQVIDWLKFVVGGQANKVPNVDLNISPRIAAIASFESGLGFKLLYGQAFRSPNAAENGLTVFRGPDTLNVGNPDLKPEVISTFEPQISYLHHKGNIAINYFYSHQKDLIQSDQVYGNVGDLTSQGVELEWKLIPIEDLYLTGSMAYQTNEDTTGQKDIYGLPNTMFKLGASYTFKELATISLFNSYYSKSNQEGGFQNLDRLSSFNWMTAKLNLNLNQFVNVGNTFGLSFEAVNVLDEKVYNPTILIGNSKQILQTMPGRAFYVSAYFRL